MVLKLEWTIKLMKRDSITVGWFEVENQTPKKVENHCTKATTTRRTTPLSTETTNDDIRDSPFVVCFNSLATTRNPSLEGGVMLVVS